MGFLAFKNREEAKRNNCWKRLIMDCKERRNEWWNRTMVELNKVGAQVV